MGRKVRRYDPMARRREAEARRAWARVDEVWRERNAAREAQWQAEDKERAIRRQRDVANAELVALQGALGIGLDPLAITITMHALEMVRLNWRTVATLELRRQFEDQMRQVFEGAVVPLVGEASSIGELDRLLGDQGRINVAVGREIVRAGELERGH